MRKVKRGQIYKHFKGMIMEVLYVASSADDLRDLVVYKHVDDDKIWVRNMDEFLSEVDHEKYPDIKQKYRFELIDERKS